MRGWINPRPNVGRRCLRTLISCLSNMFVATCRATAPWSVKIGRMASTIAFVQVVTVIGFPNVCKFIDDGHPAVKSRRTRTPLAGTSILRGFWQAARGYWRWTFCCCNLPENAGILWRKIALIKTLKASVSTHLLRSNLNKQNFFQGV